MARAVFHQERSALHVSGEPNIETAATAAMSESRDREQFIVSRSSVYVRKGGVSASPTVFRPDEHAWAALQRVVRVPDM